MMLHLQNNFCGRSTNSDTGFYIFLKITYHIDWGLCTSISAPQLLLGTSPLGASQLFRSKNLELPASEWLFQFPRDERFNNMAVVQSSLIFGNEEESFGVPLKGGHVQVLEETGVLCSSYHISRLALDTVLLVSDGGGGQCWGKVPHFFSKVSYPFWSDDTRFLDWESEEPRLKGHPTAYWCRDNFCSVFPSVNCW